MATSFVHSSVCFVVFFSIFVLIFPTSSGHDQCIKANPSGRLNPNYYKLTCPGIFDIVRDIVQKAIDCDPRMGASLLRLHFHDCWVNVRSFFFSFFFWTAKRFHLLEQRDTIIFKEQSYICLAILKCVSFKYLLSVYWFWTLAIYNVQSCDGSVLLIDIGNFKGEQSAFANKNSLRGFDVVAAIKSALNEKCLCGNVVSCADILAIAASESVRIVSKKINVYLFFFWIHRKRINVYLYVHACVSSKILGCVVEEQSQNCTLTMARLILKKLKD